MTVDQLFRDRPDIRYRADPTRTAWRAVGAESVLLDLDSSVYFGMNRSAGILWTGLLTVSTVDQLVDALLAADPAPAGRVVAQAQVLEFLRAVDAEKLLQTVDADG